MFIQIKTDDQVSTLNPIFIIEIKKYSLETKHYICIYIANPRSSQQYYEVGFKSKAERDVEYDKFIAEWSKALK